MSQLALAVAARRSAQTAAAATGRRPCLSWIDPSRRFLHACGCRRVAAVFGGDDAHDSAPAPPLPLARRAPAPSAQAPTAAAAQSSTVMRSLQSLFAGLPDPAATAMRMQQVQPPSEAVAAVSGASAAAAAASSLSSAISFAPPIAPAEAASAAQAAITYITPQYLVYVRSSPSDAPGSITPQSLLARAFAAGLRWADEHGITARHIKVVTSTEAGMDFSALAGFECQTAFYLTFPRHETRSNARVKMLQLGLVGTRSHLTQTMEEALGWRMLRYPAQLLIKGVPLLPANSALPKPPRSLNAQGLPSFMRGDTHERKLDPRALLSMARAAGLPGWADLDDSFFEDHKPQSIGGGNLSTRGQTRFDYAIRVPPIKRYMDAVAAIAASAPKVRAVMGWTVHTGIADRIEGDVPMTFVDGVPTVPVLPSRGGAPRSSNAAADAASPPSSPAASLAAARPTLTSTLAAINATLPKSSSAPLSPLAEEPLAPVAPITAEEPVPPTETTVASPPTPEAVASDSAVPLSDPSSSSPAPAPAPAPVPWGSRVYFYYINDRGQVFVEGERAPDVAQVTRTNELKHSRTIATLLSNLRKSRELLRNEPRLQDKLDNPVRIPEGCMLWYLTQQPAFKAPAGEPGTLPLSLCPTEYPWVSVCMGELNFVRARVTPIVFSSLRVSNRLRLSSSSSSSAFVLSYGAGGPNQSCAFQPDKLVIDSAGMLFHPAPPLPSGRAPTSPATSSLSNSPSSLPSSVSPSHRIAETNSNPNPYDLGLVESRLALELDIQEMEWSAAERDSVARAEEQDRQINIEAHEEYQRTLARAPASITQLPDAWIADWIAAQRVGPDGVTRMHSQPSEFVLVWQKRTYRVARLQERVDVTSTHKLSDDTAAPDHDSHSSTPQRSTAHRRSAR